MGAAGGIPSLLWSACQIAFWRSKDLELVPSAQLVAVWDLP